MGSSKEKSLKEKTAGGLLWGGLGSGGMQVLNLLFGIFLSRILTPSDYGLVGSLTIFSALAVIFSESGFILAIVNKKNVDDDDYNAMFWFNVVMSVSIYLLLWFCAPLIARFYGQPEMIRLSRFIFIGFVASALSSAPAAYFFRNLEVKTRSTVQLCALAISGTGGLISAFAGLGYWAIAIQTVLYTSFNSLILWLKCPWRPRFSFRMAALRALLPFSIKQLVVSVFTQFNNNIFSVLLGRFYGMRVTGFYTQGYKWTTMGSITLTGMLTAVGQPVLRQTVDDPERLRRVFRKLLRFTALVSFPLLFGLAIVAREVIVLLVTDKWIESVEVMRILCVGAAFIPLSTLYGNLFNSIGRPGVYMWNTIALGVLQTLCLCITYRWGLAVMLTGYSLLNVLWVTVWQFFARRYIGLKFRRVLADLLPYLFAAVAVMGITVAVTATVGNLVLSLCAKVAMAIVLYAGAVRVIRPGDFREAVKGIRGRL